MSPPNIPEICIASPKVVAKYPNTTYTTPEKHETIISLFYFSIVTVAINFTAFVLFKQYTTFPRLRLRRAIIVAVYGTAVLFYTFAELFPDVLGLFLMPCWITVFLDLLLVPMLGALVIVRNCTFLMLTRFSQIVFRYGRVMDDSAEEGSEVFPSILARVKWALGTLWYILKSLTRPEALALDVDAASKTQTLEQLKFITSRAGMLSLLVLLLIPWWIFAALYVFLDPVSTQCTGCRRDQTQTAIIIGEGFIFLCSTAVITVRVRKLPDEWGMFREARISLWCMIVAFIGLVLVGFETSVPPTSRYDHQIVLCLGLDTAFFVVSGVQVILAYIDQLNRGQQGGGSYGNNTRKTVMSQRSDISGADSGVSGNTGTPPTQVTPLANVVDASVAKSLTKILADPEQATEFERHLANEFSLEGLSFLKAVAEWRSNFRDVTSSARTARARRVYRTYIHHAGLLVINLPSHIKDKITKTLDGNADLVPITLFDDAKMEISKLMERDAVPRFRNKQKVATATSPGVGKRRVAGMDDTTTAVVGAIGGGGGGDHA